MATGTEFKIKAVIDGLEGVKALSSSVKKLQQATRPADLEFKKLANSTAKLARSSDISEKELRASVFTMRELRDNTRIASNEYRKFTREIERAEKRLRSLNKTGRSGGQFGKAAAAVGGSALLGGDAFVGAGIGAGIGAMFGMPLAGAGAGALAGNMIIRPIREASSEVASYSARLNLAKTALGAVSDTQEDYNRSLAIARQVSKDYTVDLLDTLDGYSKISAAAKANNLTLQETEDIFRGVMSAGVAFGGSQADLQALIRATTQVLSKGKVSAEEMQGQIGERLPGAVAKFAEATGRELPELSKAFELGEVTIADFVKFSQKQVQTYDEVAKIIGSSPEKAGERLKLALDTAKENYGTFFQSLGAGFQDSATKVVAWFNTNQEKVKGLVVEFANSFDKTKQITQLFLEEIRMFFQKNFGWLTGFVQWTSKTVQNLFKELGKGMESALGATEIGQKIDQIIKGKGKYTIDDLFPEFKPDVGSASGSVDETLEENKKKVNDFLKGTKAGLTSYKDSIKEFSESVADAVTNAFKKMEDTLVNFVMTGKLAFQDLARSIIESMARIAIQQTIMKPFTGWFESLFEKNAKGAVHTGNTKVKEYAKGGMIINSPHYKMMANGGIAVAGEAGSEAILPLKRGRGGRLGVEMSGGGGTTVNVSVNADGTSVEGEYDRSRQLGQAIAAAVQQQLVQEQRPGGLLYG